MSDWRWYGREPFFKLLWTQDEGYDLQDDEMSYDVEGFGYRVWVCQASAIRLDHPSSLGISSIECDIVSKGALAHGAC